MIEPEHDPTHAELPGIGRRLDDIRATLDDHPDDPNGTAYAALAAACDRIDEAINALAEDDTEEA